MSFSQIPLLITASLDAGRTPQVALRDTQERTIKHMEGLISWLRDPAIHRIVFAKNCAARIRPEVLMEEAKAHGKELEFVQTVSSPRTSVQGKGYGEGDLIRQALEQSELMRSADEFVKITGKLYTPQALELFSGESAGNFLLNTETGTGADSWRRQVLGPFYQSEAGCGLLGLLRRTLHVPWGLVAAPVTGWIDTRVYRVRRDRYERVLLNSYRRVHDALGYTLEAAFYDDLREQSDLRLIREMPVILGTSGTLGTTAGAYSAEIQVEALNLARKLLVSS
jgi:hypothetical protein